MVGEWSGPSRLLCPLVLQDLLPIQILPSAKRKHHPHPPPHSGKKHYQPVFMKQTILVWVHQLKGGQTQEGSCKRRGGCFPPLDIKGTQFQKLPLEQNLGRGDDEANSSSERQRRGWRSCRCGGVCGRRRIGLSALSMAAFAQHAGIRLQN